MTLICKDCDFFVPNGHDDGWGSCKHEKVTDEDDYSGDALIQGGGFDRYGDFIRMKPDFGCILFKKDKS